MQPEGTALVTGASRGIGRAVAIEMADRGFDVVAAMRDPAAGETLRTAGNGRLEVAELDVTRPETIEVPDELAVLVNNAGIDSAYLPVEHAPMDLWRDVMETNLFGLVEVTRRAIPSLRAAGGGVICNVTSSSLLAPVPFYAAYRASKAAVAALGESLRAELAPFGIRIVEILPGPVETDMLAESDRLPEAAAYPDYEGAARRFHEGRRGVEGMTTPAAAAAARVVDAICDDDGPLRYGCDDLAAGMLDAWRVTSDEDLMAAMLPGFLPDPEG